MKLGNVLKIRKIEEDIIRKKVNEIDVQIMEVDAEIKEIVKEVKFQENKKSKIKSPQDYIQLTYSISSLKEQISKLISYKNLLLKKREEVNLELIEKAKDRKAIEILIDRESERKKVLFNKKEQDFMDELNSMD